MDMYFGPDGCPIERDAWATLWGLRQEDRSSDSWWRRQTKIDEQVDVSTIWLGINHGWDEGSPLIWETMIFGGDHDKDQWRYPSRQEALDDHERIVGALRAGESPE